MNKCRLYAGLFCTGAIALVSDAWQSNLAKHLKQAMQLSNTIVVANLLNNDKHDLWQEKSKTTDLKTRHPEKMYRLDSLLA
ncbi:hypothetical protein MTO98_31265 [Mucilaginibacter sp. SMC90]|uniref:hypothetical protein n=1 Tax=Mucilaginibacter sp. SMC90 TaxID=2929803 RepID=UPI001FB33757|nr:hypothetical protein [Mucilaginibacter sp. SMC90]UOE48883.1 hypothetical protein MTO98_31265 [Mucilaginibacter sp. SMC90]